MDVVSKRGAFSVGLQLPKRVRKVGCVALVVPAILVLSACSEQDKDAWSRAAMPEGASDRSPHIIEFWQWTWVAALIVGVFVWGLIFYAIIRFRRRSDDEIPVQTRYNLPMEILYTIAPVVIVLVFFYFTVDTQNKVAADRPTPTTRSRSSGSSGRGRSTTSRTTRSTADDGLRPSARRPTDPTLYLPVGESVRSSCPRPTSSTRSGCRRSLQDGRHPRAPQPLQRDAHP